MTFVRALTFAGFADQKAERFIFLRFTCSACSFRQVVGQPKARKLGLVPCGQCGTQHLATTADVVDSPFTK